MISASRVRLPVLNVVGVRMLAEGIDNLDNGEIPAIVSGDLGDHFESTRRRDDRIQGG